MGTRLLAVDLGSEVAGWAYFGDAELLQVGTWELSTKRHESPGFRWIRFRAALDAIVEVSRLRVDLLAWEEVRNHVSPRKGRPGPPAFNVAAAHAYGGAQATLLSWADLRGIPYASVQIASVKAAALGKGGGKGTDKAAVLAAARRRWPRHRFDAYDAADAAFIGLALLIDLGKVDKTLRPEPDLDATAPARPVRRPGGLFD